MILPVEPGVIDLITILFIAYVYDLVLNEPPFSIHPVVWMGKLISGLKKKAPAKNRRLYGIFLGLFTIAFAMSIAYIVLLFFSIEAIPKIVRILVVAYFLKSTFAVRCLFEAAREIQKELGAGRLDGARKGLSMYVSRDTSKLDEGHVSSSIIETVSENYVDGILTPLLFYSMFGPFGLITAYMFKAVSTLDSMVGYKDEKHLEMGWFSARLDDVFNWIPARLSIYFIAAASLIINIFSRNGKKPSPSGTLKCAFSDCLKTPSPNSGFPMASVAGALGVKLEKPNTYVLGENYPFPASEDIKLTAWIIMIASFLAVVFSSVVIYSINKLILI
ncbi:cobalamin biosynthesis protein [Methanolobus sp. ZRKC3]|uniref:cobalamin biosynthesis protein n=1 Tax=Methanolobus sp. ZRKC3 TaxID=3125786 RepID=UPI00324F1E85